MITATYTDLRSNLKDYLDRVVKDSDNVIVNRGGGSAVVIMSMEEYESMVETAYVMSQPDLVEAIRQGDEDVKNAQAEKQKAESERDELQRKLDMITAEAGNKTGWDLVKACIDPAYAAVLEELTKRLVEKFNLDELEPQEVLISFFMQYYYNQEWEFSGMPFIMKQSEILEIVQGVYPDMTAKVLRQALQVKKK